ncbi:biotin--[acetyl-CoA-carboxylase] ligase [Pedobacter sp. KR3-3]|uniref:biotin--[biotin carboxyl-carrier protein] ligase n=1 Tax=Pedobacter albus TaxID=3113905 RepID=A0ABU7ICT7_9SPHI|nr:biotin--[acetyl-CoA-carboxylase] ligase [Pedobacter sp. KR3-3]MEE1947300.1 biotin--[acetyl-CoA-carboxylase] ligase [Pedobacter sp. KR3-3]
MQNNTFSTLFVGQNLIKLSAVDSTNNFLKNLVSNSEPLAEGTVIMAENQYAGRGQQQNTWHAEPGKNLTFSVLLRPGFLPLDKQFLLNMVVSVAVNRVLSAYVPSGMRIKWPNDVYYFDQKMGGILIENTIVGSTIKTAVIGIGLNVNQQVFAPELKQRATSLGQILQQDVNLDKLLSEICTELERLYLQLRAGHYTELRQSYVDRLYRFDQPANYRQNGEVFEGTIKGISDLGLLCLEKEGQMVEYNFKEIEFLTHI